MANGFNMITTRTRNLRFGWSNSIHTPPGERHWRFVEFGPTTGPLGMAGIIRAYREMQRQNQTNEHACAIWQGEARIASGEEVRHLISEWQAERAWERYSNR